MDREKAVAAHYSRAGLERAILEALKTSGSDIEPLTTSVLSAVDEFHLGWRTATEALAESLALAPGLRLLDIGCGIGGPARYFAEAHDCRVTGIDLTEDYIETATALTARCGLSGRVSFRRASALSLPFGAESFDRCTLIHVGMNIEDKARLFAEVRRVLKPGGLFGLYDVMRTAEGEVRHPVPWAASLETSFLDWPEVYRKLLEDAGFSIAREEDRSEMALRLIAEMRERTAREGTSPLGIHILMGPATKERFGNVIAALEAGIVAPVEMIAQ